MSLLRRRGKTAKIGKCTLADVAHAQADALLRESIDMATRIYLARVRRTDTEPKRSENAASESAGNSPTI